jgi:hypothetical protein
MVEPVRHRQTKEAETDMFEPKATASHLDSTLTDLTSGIGDVCSWVSGAQEDVFYEVFAGAGLRLVKSIS